jgi:hypothetical protein
MADKCPTCGSYPYPAFAGEPPRAKETLDRVKLLTDRAEWYRDGCDGLEDRDGYYASGDCASDAASDLESALAEITALRQQVQALERQLTAYREAPITTTWREHLGPLREELERALAEVQTRDEQIAQLREALEKAIEVIRTHGSDQLGGDCGQSH